MEVLSVELSKYPSNVVAVVVWLWIHSEPDDFMLNNLEKKREMLLLEYTVHKKFWF